MFIALFGDSKTGIRQHKSPVCLSVYGEIGFRVLQPADSRPDGLLMTRFLSNCRPLIHAALAALVVAALSRCSWEESRELAQSLRIAAIQAAGQTAPIQVPLHDCDRESGCICRGATQALAIDAAHCKPACTDLLPVDLVLAPE